MEFSRKIPILGVFLISGDTYQEIDKGRFPPFGSVLPEFELWEAVLRQFWVFFDFWRFWSLSGSCIQVLKSLEFFSPFSLAFVHLLQLFS